jgi:5,6,7,8-tetrahydromethanopterin hydro-lyase
MPRLLAARTYVVLAVACLLGFGGGALLVAAEAPGILYYALGVLLVGLYTLQALKPGAGVRPFRRGSTKPSEPYLPAPPVRDSQDQPTTDARPSTGTEPSTGAAPRSLSVSETRTLSVGESLVGEGNEVAHVDVMIGSKSGPVGKAFARSLVNQKEGHTNLLAIVAPNLPAKPDTIISNKVTIKGATQAVQMFGPAQAAVARGVVDSVREGVISQGAVDDLCIVCGVFIHWEATDDKKVFDYNYQATKEAIARAMSNEPSAHAVLDSAEAAHHSTVYAGG